MIEEYKKLINSDEFKKWFSKNKDSYLSSCFSMQDPNSNSEWNFDYYLPKKNKITTFVVSNEITLSPDQKIFEKTKGKLKEIKLDDIKFSLDDANKFIEKEFKGRKLLKKIIVLQFLDGLIWNISLLCLDFNLINLKLDANNGKLLDKSETLMLQFNKAS